jgi:3-hydroxyacyl-[acyl-carrier-protein] dehydratase
VRWILIDRLIACDPGKRAVGLKSFTRSELFFMDHFPERPIVPGVLQIEMIAQTGGRCIRIANPAVFTLLSKVHSAKFIHPITPGDQCRITVEIMKLRSNYGLASGVIEVAGEKVAEAELMYALVPRDRLDHLDPVIEDWEKDHRAQGAINEQSPVETGAIASR